MVKRCTSASGHANIHHNQKSDTYTVQMIIGGKSVTKPSSTLEDALAERDRMRHEQKTARAAKAIVKPKTVKEVMPRQKGVRSFTIARARATAAPAPRHTPSLARLLPAILKSTVKSISLVFLRSGSPLATKSSKVRGVIAENVCRKILGPTATAMPDKHPYDYERLQGDKTVRGEVKLARMYYNSYEAMWIFYAQNVKPHLSDEILLVLEGLKALYVFEWKGKGLLGSGASEKNDDGKIIQFYSTSRLTDPNDGELSLVQRMCEDNTLLRTISYDDPEFATLFAYDSTTGRDYTNVPLSSLQGVVRGAILEKLVSELLVEFGHTVVPPDPGVQTNGDVRPSCRAEYDLLMDTLKTEVKSALMVKCGGKTPRYQIQFPHVRAHHHDQRILVWMSPQAIHIWLQPPGNDKYLSHSHFRSNITITSSTHKAFPMNDPRIVEDYLLKKMAFSGYEYVARLDLTDAVGDLYHDFVTTTPLDWQREARNNLTEAPPSRPLRPMDKDNDS